MNETKDLAKLSLEELMEIAKLPLKDSDYKHFPPARRFIISEGIEAGEDLVPSAIILYRYNQWSKNNNLEPVGSTLFFREFKKYFNKKQTNSGSYYKLSVKGFDVSLQNLSNAIDALYPEKRISRGLKKRKPPVKKSV
jgi:hypothetical protein